jgi:hypothetical protein
MIFNVISNNTFNSRSQRIFSYVSASSIVLGFRFGPVNVLSWFCIRIEVFFAHTDPIVPGPFLEMAIHFPLNFLCVFVKIQLYFCG